LVWLFHITILVAFDLLLVYRAFLSVEVGEFAVLSSCLDAPVFHFCRPFTWPPSLATCIPPWSPPLLHFSATPLGRADCRNLKCANWLPESCQKLCLKFIYLFFLPVSPCSSFFIPFLCLAMQNKVGKMKILQAREDFVKDK